MPTPQSVVQFKAGLQANFNLIETKDTNTVYFITDKQRIFVGDVEYTRPVQHGTNLPEIPEEGYVPKNSLFVKETGTKRELYLSKDGSSWELVSVLPATIAAGIVGDNSAIVEGELGFGDSFVVPRISYDEHGFITVASDVTLTLPEAPADASVTVTPGTAGNVVTSVEKGTGATEIIVNKSTIQGSGNVTGNATTFVTGVTLGANFALTGTTQAADTNVATGSTIPTTSAVKTYVDTQDATTLQSAKDYADSILGANDAMLFKGTVGGAESGATVTDFGALTDYKTGWTYRVIEAGTYAGVECEIGDLLIAVTDYSDAFDNADWTVAQTNIDGAVISDAALVNNNVVVGAGGQKVKDSGVALSSLATTQSVTDVDGKVTALESRVSAAEGEIDTLQDDVTALQSKTYALTDLTDTEISDPQQGNGLVYDSASGKWKNGPIEADSVAWSDVEGRPTISLKGDVTGTINLETGEAVTTAIAAGVIVDADINANANIAQSKINNTTGWITDALNEKLTAESSLDATKLTGGPIPSTVTATTASAGDNSTAIATTAFVTEAVNNSTLKWGTF